MVIDVRWNRAVKRNVWMTNFASNQHKTPMISRNHYFSRTRRLFDCMLYLLIIYIAILLNSSCGLKKYRCAAVGTLYTFWLLLWMIYCVLWNYIPAISISISGFYSLCRTFGYIKFLNVENRRYVQTTKHTIANTANSPCHFGVNTNNHDI